MNYKLYKFQFNGAVHFGKQNLDEGESSCCADTIFSALCQEAVRMGEDTLEYFCACVREEKLLLSDAFPYMENTYFVPKPMKRLELQRDNSDSIIKKAYKKLKYIPVDLLETYLQGNFDVMNAHDFHLFGHFEMKTAAAVRGETETVPYRIGSYYYNPGNGLYLIVGYQDEKLLELAEELLERLSYSGIGGKRASGFGRFQLILGKMPSGLCRRLERTGENYMTLSVSLPREEELETALAGAEYLLLKRSGFVASERYAPEQMRKKDLYVFQAGSCFPEKFHGDIYDVSDTCGRHPVYRYAKPMWMEVQAYE